MHTLDVRVQQLLHLRVTGTTSEFAITGSGVTVEVTQPAMLSKSRGRDAKTTGGTRARILVAERVFSGLNNDMCFSREYVQKTLSLCIVKLM